MPAKVKPVRLKKAATELNVGLKTIVNFLNERDIEIDNNPNAKITPDVYELLLEEFASSKELKNKAKTAGLPKSRKETVSLKERPGAKGKKKDSDEVLLVDTQGVSGESEEDEETTGEEEKQQEQKKEEAPEEEKQESPKPKVVGKIELDKPSKEEEETEEEAPQEEAPETSEAPEAPEEEKEEEPTEAKKEEAPEAETTKQESSAEEKEEKKEEEQAAEEEKPEEEKEKKEGSGEGLIKAKAEKLSGPTVVGKIDLPEKKKPKKKQPVASSSDSSNTLKGGKRKRKRISRSKGGGEGKRGGRRGKKKEIRPEMTEAEIQKEVRQTLAQLQAKSGGKGSKARRERKKEREEERERQLAEQAEQEKKLEITEYISVQELASMMDVSPTDIIKACMSLGIIATINQRLDAEAINIIAEEFGYEVEFTTAEIQESIEEEDDAPETMEPRAPVVTVMGHVDHGKTSLLDFIREENVIGGEAGGITQHIGAYSVELDENKRITFLDTPGHEAFTAMRARGAQVTDLAIIVIAADDNVMPQTKEAINHAQAAGIPMVFAINKIDKPGANPDRVKEELANMNILVEDWGGKFQSQEISAKTGDGVRELLEKVHLQAELLELQANAKKRAVGTILESSLDKGRGYVCNVLVEAGTLRVGDPMLSGMFSGKVKAMYNELGKEVEEAGPSTPVSVLGFNGAPSAGEKFNVMEDEREARQIANKREQLLREQGVRASKHITLDEIGRRIAIGDFQELNVIVKGDVDGSIEALSDSIEKLSTDNIQVNVIHKAVGAITESDVMLASASDAIIVGFQVRPTASARKVAEREGIQIRIYSVIYAAIEELRDAMEGMLAPTIEEKVIGNAEIRNVFKISKIGKVAGCYVTDGKITRNSKVRLIRDGIVIYTGELGSLKRFKDDAKEVAKGYECGLNVANYNDIKVGDIIEAFEEVEVKQKLSE